MGAIKCINVIDASLVLDEAKFNTILARHASWKLQYRHYDSKNKCGIHVKTYGSSKPKYYYLQSEGNKIGNPTICKPWRDRVEKQQDDILTSLKSKERETELSKQGWHME